MTQCNLCNSNKYKILYETKKEEKYSYYSGSNFGRIVKCCNCGLIYKDPVEKDLKEKYGRLDDKDYLKSKEARIEKFKIDLSKIEEYKKNGKLLDIGCGHGLFLEVAKSKGWDGCGIELSKEACRYGRNLGLNIINKSLEEARFREDSFDVITLWDVIEHVEKPSEILRLSNSILKKKGIIVFSTPNIGSLFAKIMGKKWWNLMNMHLYYFDRKTIKRILEKNGFSVLKIKSYPRIIIPKYAVEWLKQYKSVYKLFKLISDKTFVGNLKIKINFFDSMIVYAKKI